MYSYYYQAGGPLGIFAPRLLPNIIILCARLKLFLAIEKREGLWDDGVIAAAAVQQLK